MAEEKTHLIMQDCIISQFGKVDAGFEISEGDVDSVTWIYLNRNNIVRSKEAIVAAADADESTAVPSSDTTNEQSEGETEESVDSSDDDTAAIIARVKELLSGGKLKIDAIAGQTGIAENVLSALLTEHNGFSKTKSGVIGLI